MTKEEKERIEIPEDWYVLEADTPLFSDAQTEHVPDRVYIHNSDLRKKYGEWLTAIHYNEGIPINNIAAHLAKEENLYIRKRI